MLPLALVLIIVQKLHQIKIGIETERERETLKFIMCPVRYRSIAELCQSLLLNYKAIKAQAKCKEYATKSVR